MSTPPDAATPAGRDSGDHRRRADWDLSSGVTSYLFVVAGFGFSSLLALALAMVATRLLQPSGYGVLMAVFAVSQVAQAAAIMWSAQSVATLGGMEFIATGRLANVFWTRTMLLMGGLVIILATSWLWGDVASRAFRVPRDFVVPVLINAASVAIWAHAQQALFAAKRQRVQSTLIVVERAVAIVFLFVVALRGPVGVDDVIFAYAAGAIASSCIALVVIRKLITPLAIRRDVMQRILRFSGPLLASTLVNTAASHHLDTLFIAHYLSTAAAGIYGVAFQISAALTLLPLVTGTFLQQYLVTLQVRDGRGAGVAFERVLELFTFGIGVVSVIVAACGPLLPMIFGAGYRGADGPLWPLMAFNAVTAPLLAAWMPAAYARHRTLAVTAYSLAFAAVNAALNWWVVPRYGIVGCGWATLAAALVALLVFAATLRGSVTIDPGKLLLLVSPVVVAATVAGIAGGTLLPLAIGGCVAVVVAVVRRRAFAEAVGVLRELIARGRQPVESAS